MPRTPSLEPDPEERPTPSKSGEASGDGLGSLVVLFVLGLTSFALGVGLDRDWISIGGNSNLLSLLMLVGGLLLLYRPVRVLINLIRVYQIAQDSYRQYSPSRTDVKLAKRMISRTGAMYESAHEYRAASQEDFYGLDLSFYDQSRDKLLSLDFQYVGDIVDETIEELGYPTVPIRLLTSPSGATVACVYHLRMQSPMVRGGRSGVRFFEVGSEFSDGSFLMTSNGAEHDLLDSPHTIRKCRHPLDTPVEVLLQLHEKEKGTILDSNPGLAIVPARTLDEVLAGTHRQQQIKIEFRRSIGFLRGDEVRRIGRSSGADHVEHIAKAVDDQRPSANGPG